MAKPYWYSFPKGTVYELYFVWIDGTDSSIPTDFYVFFQDLDETLPNSSFVTKNASTAIRSHLYIVGEPYSTVRVCSLSRIQLCTTGILQYITIWLHGYL